MSVELRVPQGGESISEVQIGQWRKREGESVDQDEVVVELETDKASMELPAPASGVLSRIAKQAGESARVGEVIAVIDEAAKPQEGKPAARAPEARGLAAAPPAPERAPAAPPAPAREPERRPAPAAAPAAAKREPHVMPAARRVMAERKLEPSEVTPTGPGERILKEDAVRAAEERERAEAAPPAREEAARPEARRPEARREEAPRAEAPPPAEPAEAAPAEEGREEEIVPMTLIRRRIAERLVQAQQTAALLTTFNEIDMSAVQALRQEYKDAFQEKYKIKLGFMSFFVKASIEALKFIPQVNAEVRETNIVYRNYFDIGVAVGGGRGLVVPVLRNAERMSFAQIERTIADFAARARENKLTVDELQGGTFTISNGGVYGSLLSTPIVNPPQSGILGLHAIQDRPVVRNGQIVIRPMMYVALTYDHRIVDGREAVTFLKRIKEIVENPARMLIEV